MTESLWADPVFRETAYLIFGVLFVLGVGIAPFRKKHSHFVAAWASLKSWFFAAPIIVLVLSFGEPWILIALTFAAVLGAKEFFQITGMYHRSLFVWLVYFGILALGFCIYYDLDQLYDLMPMIVLAVISLVPILKNEYKNMVQYLALSLFNFIFLGWALLHTGRIAQWDHGPFYLIYIMILTEVCDNIVLSTSALLGRTRPAEKINSRRTIEGLAVAFVLTLALAYGMRHLLPKQEPQYWLASGIIAFLAGSLGDLVLAVIRRDLGVKDRGAFILGRGTLLDLMDRVIFVAPIYYYGMQIVEKVYP